MKEFHNKEEYEGNLPNIFLAPYILHIPDSYTLVSSEQVCRI